MNTGDRFMITYNFMNNPNYLEIKDWLFCVTTWSYADWCLLPMETSGKGPLTAIYSNPKPGSSAWQSRKKRWTDRCVFSFPSHLLTWHWRWKPGICPVQWGQCSMSSATEDQKTYATGPTISTPLLRQEMRVQPEATAPIPWGPEPQSLLPGTRCLHTPAVTEEETLLDSKHFFP